MSPWLPSTSMQDDKRHQSAALRRRRWRRVMAAIYLPLDWIAGQTAVALLLPGGLCLVLALLYVRPYGFPAPRIHDEFSYLLGADTFAAGRLSNPTHSLWVHFESPHINQIPRYVSMYHPAQALVLAAGQRIGGHPWYGVLASAAIMCVAVSWMLRVWLPPRWALLGSLIAVQIAVFGGRWEPWTGYWVASYWGGAVAASGGALVIGALGRLRRRLNAYDSVLFAAGVAILANSRPYEGAVLTVTAAGLLAFTLLRSGVLTRTVLQKLGLPAAIIMVFSAAGTTYYCWRTTGNPLRLPYQENLRQYMMRRMFIWGDHQPKVYRHEALANVYKSLMREHLSYKKKAYDAARRIVSFYIGPVLSIPLLMIVFVVVRDRRIWPVLTCCAAVLLSALLIDYVHIHYVAPVTGALILITIQCLRHLAARLLRSMPAGRLGALFIVAVSFVLSGYRAWDGRGWRLSGWPIERERIQAALVHRGGEHLILVRYSGKHDPSREWVYNAADIDASPVVWAREMADNSALLKYFSARRIWLLEADVHPAKLQPYRQQP